MEIKKKNIKAPVPITKFFDLLNVFFEKKDIPTDEEIQKHCNQFMLNLTLSCDPQMAEIAHEMCKIKISNKEYFDCLYYGLPKGKRYIPYNAQKAKKEEDVQYIAKYYKCNNDVARTYRNLIDDAEAKRITELYTKQGVRR